MKQIALITGILLISFLAFSQTPTSPKSTSPKEEDKKSLKKGVSGQYKTVTLGMSREEVMEKLKQDVELEVDVETDYGDFDKDQQYLLKAKRKPFINHIYYQFAKRKNDHSENENDKEKWILYGIIINFNEKYNDYVSLYERLLSKYGEADIRTSHYAVWKPADRELFKSSDGRDIRVRLILDIPGTIKIFDDTIHQERNVEKKQTPNEAVKTYQKELNERLLKDFVPSDESIEKSSGDK